MAVNREMIIQKGLSEWWSEEIEYMLQRIERWATFARGYNRLRSQGWLKNGRTAQERQDSCGPARSNVKRTSRQPQFWSIEQSRRKSRSEESRIDCCGTFNYQSNSKLDNNCLDTYRYDHSIYFKTIGDIKSSKINDGLVEDENEMSISIEKCQEVNVNSLIDLLADEIIFEKIRDNNRRNNPNIFITSAERETNRETRNVWPIGDLIKLDLDAMETPCIPHPFNREDNRDETQQWTNDGNVNNIEVDFADIETWQKNEDRLDNQGPSNDQRRRSFIRSRRLDDHRRAHEKRQSWARITSYGHEPL